MKIFSVEIEGIGFGNITEYVIRAKDEEQAKKLAKQEYTKHKNTIRTLKNISAREIMLSGDPEILTTIYPY